MAPKILRRRHPTSSAAQILFYNFWRIVTSTVMILLWRARWTGNRLLPQSGALLIVSNHQSYIDPPFVGGAFTRRDIDFIARGGLFSFRPFAWALRNLNCIPIAENGGDTAAMKEALRRLDKGCAVLIFPEGARTPDGDIQEFKRGVAVLVKRANCPVLPVGIDGPFQAWPRSQKLPSPFVRIAGAIGEPISHDELMKDGPDAAIKRLHDEVGELVKQARALRTRK